MKPRLETGLCGLTHGDELFRCGRVNGNGVVEVFFGGAHFQRYRKALQHLIHSEADTVNTDNLLFRADADQLHAARLAVRGHGGIHCGEGRFVHLHGVVAVLLARLRLD